MDKNFITRESFDQLRHDKKLFDFKIVTGSREFDVHKLLLAVDSDYFRAMLTHDSKESREGTVHLHDVDPDAMESILNFCYTGKLGVTSDNVDSTLLAASHLQISSVLEECVSFLEERMAIENCLGVLTLARRVSLTNLTKTTLTYCLNNFKSIVNEPEFIDLDLDILKQLISDDQLNVDDEADVMEAIKKWIGADSTNRARHLSELMRQVRLALLNPVYLVDLDGYQHICESQDCREIVNIAKNFMILKNYPEKQKAFREQLNTVVRPANKRQRLYAVGGWTDQYRSIATAEVYNPNKDCWTPIMPMTQKRCGVGLVTFKESMYAIGGHDGLNYLNSVERYDVNRESWCRDVADMKYVRTSIGVAALDGHIYAIGGQISSGAIDKNERYDPVSNTWTECAPLQSRRLGAGVVSCKGYIYVMGGSDGNVIFDSVERYDPRSDSWTTVTSMHVPRKHLGSCCCADKIYAVGGRNLRGELSEAESYDPATGTWTNITPMQKGRCGIGLVALGGKIYAVGGSNQDIRLDLVESYDPDTDSWTACAPMDACRLGGGMAAYPPI